MKTIHKYILPRAAPSQTFVATFDGCTALCASLQGERLCLWMEVDDKEPAVRHSVYVTGTGHPLPEKFDWDYEYVSTVIDGKYVWHVYIACEPEPEET